MKSKNVLRGFTLVELLVVMAIMSVLIGISVAGLGFAMRRSRNIARQSAATNLDRSLEAYYSDFQNYPTSAAPASITTIESLITSANALQRYLEGSWEAPPRTCMAYGVDNGGIRYVVGVSQENTGGNHSCYWTGPGVGAGQNWPVNDGDPVSCVIAEGAGIQQMYLQEIIADNDFGDADCNFVTNWAL